MIRADRCIRWPGFILAGLLLFGCGSNTVRSVNTAPLISGDPSMAEDQLLDVGVRLFASGADKLTEEELFTAPEIREAEARFMPTVLVSALAQSAHWGTVRVVPEGTGYTDVVIDGSIVSSTGEELILDITPSDASGAVWYTKRYEGHASKYSYEQQAGADPFQDVYNRIANDLALHRAKFPESQVNSLRQLGELRFAESFSPQAFGGYLQKDKKGIYRLSRLPAEGDPMLTRIRLIRERDYMFVDTLQDYYSGFAKEMSGPYHDWRRETYTEALQYQQLKRQATARTIAGVAAILGGIVATTGDSQASNVAGAVGIMGGAALIKSGIGKRQEAKLHAETLKELGGSLSADITPQVIDLDDRSVTLTGTVQDQYGQWREILHGIYKTETGSI